MSDSARLHAAIYEAPLPARRLPSLLRALEDTAVEALSPTALPAPAGVVDLLAAARRVLVVSHVPPDGDCVGSALGLARALAALGKHAVAVVDAPLPGRLRGVGHGEVVDMSDPRARGAFDLVALVDVAQADRIGGARAVLESSGRVVVVDHHYVEPDRASLALASGAELEVWVEPGLESASLQVASLVDAVAARLGRALEGAARAAAMRPLAAGLYTDTEGFKLPGAGREALRMMKHLATEVGPTALEGLAGIERDLAWRLPDPAARLLDDHLEERSVPGARATVLRGSAAVLEAALGAARGEDPLATLDDVRGAVMDRLDAAAAREDLAVLLLEDAGRTWVSVRSRDAASAIRLVDDAFPGCGGGKPHAAAALVPSGLDEACARVDALLAAQRAARWVRLGANPGRGT